MGASSHVIAHLHRQECTVACGGVGCRRPLPLLRPVPENESQTSTHVAAGPTMANTSAWYSSGFVAAHAASRSMLPPTSCFTIMNPVPSFSARGQGTGAGWRGAGRVHRRERQHAAAAAAAGAARPFAACGVQHASSKACTPTHDWQDGAADVQELLRLQLAVCRPHPAHQLRAVLEERHYGAI